jgi:MFS family permease
VFEYPIGIVADRYIGEQEMMALGFVILAITTALVATMSGVSVVWWMALMFVNRIGASLVEVTTESYFFKQVHSTDASLIGLFRLLRPAANVTGALMGSILLAFLPFPILFIIGAMVLTIGVYVPRFLVDTK